MIKHDQKYDVSKMITKVFVYYYFLNRDVSRIYLSSGELNMTVLENNINHYMKIKGVKKYTHLLIMVANQLGIKGQQAYDFANREKANFSKMLKGQRPLKYEYIIPLEKIFGVSLARMMDEDSYKLPLDKVNIPYSKGFRYYAYLDDVELYKKELDTLLTTYGKNVLEGPDEFGKNFLDYVVEYNSINGIKYLRDTYHLKLRMRDNQFDTEPKGIFYFNHVNGIELARIIANSGDAQLFNDIYDPYYLFAMCGRYFNDSIFIQDDYLEILMDHQNIYSTIFERKKYECELNGYQKRRLKQDTKSFCSINPVINGVLNYALKHLDKYRDKAIEILKFGITHNKNVIDNLEDSIEHYVVDEIGVLENYNKNYEISDIVIVTHIVDIKDKEVNELIAKLPKFKNIYTGEY